MGQTIARSGAVLITPIAAAFQFVPGDCKNAISLNELAPFHSITSSVSSGNDSGIESPNALAALRLTRSGKLVDWMTGKSAGFPPRRMAPCAQGPLGAADPALTFPASSGLNAVSAR